MRKILCVSLLLAVVACNTDGDAPRPDGTWVGTIATEGSVTMVVNESGSVWGGARRWWRKRRSALTLARTNTCSSRVFSG